MKIRRKEDPLKWPLPGLTMPNQTHTDFSQLINCPEFIPRQMTEELRGKCSSLFCWNLKTSPDERFYRQITSVMIMASSSTGSPTTSSPVKQKTKIESDTSNLKTMPRGLSASLPDLDSESWIEVKKRPRPSPARPKVSAEKVKKNAQNSTFLLLDFFSTMWIILAKANFLLWLCGWLNPDSFVPGTKGKGWF